MGCHSLLQGIFPIQGSNPSLTSPELVGRFFTTSATWEAILLSLRLIEKLLFQPLSANQPVYVASVTLLVLNLFWPPRWLNSKRICLTMRETQEMLIQSLVWEDPLKEEMVTHTRILAWRILWREESGRLQSIGWQSWTWLSMLTLAITVWISGTWFHCEFYSYCFLICGQTQEHSHLIHHFFVLCCCCHTFKMHAFSIIIFKKFSNVQKS